jgi:SpoVK/Ycf46/Vps4 family AAA+-type ATPase
LPEIIAVIQSYIAAKDKIINTITEQHKTRCPKLKLKKRKAIEMEEEEEEESEIDLLVKILTYNNKRKSPSVQKWTEAICKGMVLTDYQYKALERLSGALPEIVAINNMVGMEQIKLQFMSLLKFLTNVDKDRDNSFLMHMVVSGPPGHGKTAIAQLLGKAFKQSGLLKNDVFITARRADLIGAYCGHTAKNTTAMFNKARGGVIFIDEVYSLGNKDKSDVFTKECIDTINQLLSERTDTLCIVAGYDKEIHESFFSYNKGLERRFPWRFIINEYGPKELLAIFQKLVLEMDWKIEKDAILESDFKKELFLNAGGDVANLITNCIIAHYHFNFLAMEPKMELCRDDIEKGLKEFEDNKGRSKEKDKDRDPPPPGMYC